MKQSRLRISPAVFMFISVLGYVGYLASCTQKDQILVTDPNTVNSTNLVSVRATTPPDIDGNIDAVWGNAAKLNVVPQVPDPGNGLFAGYIGQGYPATLRSVYDDQNIYFLLEYADAEKSVNVSTWYFNPTTKAWAQEPSSKVYDTNGVLTRDGFGEDKFAMLWNVAASTPKFITETCYASCHVFTPFMDYSKTPAVLTSNANSGNHYTNGSNEKIDMWWGHLGRDIMFGQVDDNYQDWAGGPNVTSLAGGNGNGRHLDGLVVTGTNATWPGRPIYSTATDGPYNNTQTLSGKSVPLYVLPGASNYYTIKQSDIDNGTAKLITAVDANGILTYAGGTIDPSVGTDFQRIGDPVYGGDGPKCIPGYISRPLTNGRADITAQATYTGAGWVVEYKRALKTGDALAQDIDFSSLANQPFGLAIWNKSNNQHGIQPNLMLQFQK